MAQQGGSRSSAERPRTPVVSRAYAPQAIQRPVALIAASDFSVTQSPEQEAATMNEALIAIDAHLDQEYGTLDGSCTADWTCLVDACQAIMPKAELEKAFDSGATHALFCAH